MTRDEHKQVIETAMRALLADCDSISASCATIVYACVDAGLAPRELARAVDKYRFDHDEWYNHQPERTNDPTHR